MSNDNRITCNQSGFIEKFSLGNGGLSFAVKDTIDVAGYQTQAGSRVYANTPVAKTSADVVKALLKKGFHCSGKTTLHELAFGVTGINLWAGTPLNPRYPTLIPGGSSSGSATAVASEDVDFAVGTDTGGSVRMPAACCGIVGLKPTFGLISRRGVMPQESSLDCVGFFARNPKVVKAVLGAFSIQTYAENDIYGSNNPAYIKALASSNMDSHIETWLCNHNVSHTPVSFEELNHAHQAGITIISHENWNSFSSIVEHPHLSDDVRTRILAGGKISPEKVSEAERVRYVMTERVDTLLENHTFLLLPALPELPPTLEEASNPLNVVNLTRLLRPFNLTGHPAIVLPVGEIDGRPVSLQIVAKKGADMALVDYAIQILNN